MPQARAKVLKTTKEAQVLSLPADFGADPSTVYNINTNIHKYIPNPS
jgi:hypothetical protein